MSWVDIAEGEDIPKGIPVRLIYRIEINPYLQWVPSQIMNFLVEKIGGMLMRIKGLALSNKLNIDRYEIETVTEGRTYRLIFYGTSLGVEPVLVMKLILGILIAVIVIIGLIDPERAQKFMAGFVAPTLGGGAVILLLLFLLMREVKR